MTESKFKDMTNLYPSAKIDVKECKLKDNLAKNLSKDLTLICNENSIFDLQQLDDNRSDAKCGERLETKSKQNGLKEWSQLSQMVDMKKKKRRQFSPYIMSKSFNPIEKNDKN